MPTTTSDVGADDPSLAAFHAGIYEEAFAAQHEPLAAWRASIASGLLRVRLAIEDGEIVGGVCFERYPRSGVGLVTYLVVAPAARGRGLGEQLLRDAITALAAPLVLGEVNDPRVHGTGEDRLARFERWGARVLDVRYVQPALGPGLARDRGLLLIAFAPRPEIIDGALVRAFVEELYAATEGGALDPEIRIPDRVALVAPVATLGPSRPR